MSISNPRTTGIKNPIRVFASFSGNTGKWKIKDADKNNTVESGKPIEGIVLDSNINKIVGWNESNEAPIRSGYFRTVEDEIKVYMGSNLLVKGKYKDEDVKLKIKGYGGKFGVVIPIVTKKGILMAIELKGAMMSEWFEYRNKVNLDKNPYLKIHSPYETQNKAGIKYFVAKFDEAKESEFPQDLISKAWELDVEFQKFMGTDTTEEDTNTEEPKTANEIADELLEQTMGKKEPVPVDDPDTEDDLPF